MNPNIAVGKPFPDFELPDHRNRQVGLSELAAPTTFDRLMGFEDGYPLVVVFYRGFY